MLFISMVFGTFGRCYYQFSQVLKFFRIIQFVFHILDTFFHIFPQKISVLFVIFTYPVAYFEFYHYCYIIFIYIEKRGLVEPAARLAV